MPLFTVLWIMTILFQKWNNTVLNYDMTMLQNSLGVIYRVL